MLRQPWFAQAGRHADAPKPFLHQGYETAVGDESVTVFVDVIFQEHMKQGAEDDFVTIDCWCNHVLYSAERGMPVSYSLRPDAKSGPGAVQRRVSAMHAMLDDGDDNGDDGGGGGGGGNGGGGGGGSGGKGG